MKAFGFSAAAALAALALLASENSFPDPAIDEKDRGSTKETAVLAGGCFWGMEAVFNHVRGVTRVVSGYSGGDKKAARSELVEAGHTGHAESVMITYQPSKITYGEILKIFFSVAHDPTELDRQGPDEGTQYRSVIFYANEEQETIAKTYIEELENKKILPRKIVTQVLPLSGFYPAEDFLQHYSERHPNDPYIVQNDLPKLAALKSQMPEVYK